MEAGSVAAAAAAGVVVIIVIIVASEGLACVSLGMSTLIAIAEASATAARCPTPRRLH